MDSQEQMAKMQRSITEFEERFKKIAISKKQSPSREQLLSDSAPLPVSAEFYRGRIPSVVLHKDLQNTLILKEVQNNPSFQTGVPVDQLCSRDVPRSNKEMTLNFSREEKLLLYDYCVKKTGHHSVADVPFSYMIGQSTPVDAGTSSSPESGMKIVTIGEIAGLEKNRRERRPPKDRTAVFKRGRSGRRTTYTDELRSLIHTQMSAWEAFLRQKGRPSTRPLKRLQ